jgi:hypothetical protein
MGFIGSYYSIDSFAFPKPDLVFCENFNDIEALIYKLHPEAKLIVSAHSFALYSVEIEYVKTKKIGGKIIKNTFNITGRLLISREST